MRKRRPCSKADRKGGQITVLFTFLIFMTVLILGVTLNIAEIFIWRGHLQTGVDCTVFSGAVVQARGLNQIAKINNQIINQQNFYRNRAWNGGRPYSSWASGWRSAASAQQSFLNDNRTLNAEQDRINVSSSGLAWAEAQRVAGLNAPNSQFRAYPNMQNRLTQISRVCGKTMNFSFRYWYHTRRGPRIRSDSGPSVSAWVSRKVTGDHTYFCGELLKPAQEYIFKWRDSSGRNLFDTFRNLRTYATAMPYGGQLWSDGQGRGVARYDVKLVRTGAVHPRPSIPDEWGYEW